MRKAARATNGCNVVRGKSLDCWPEVSGLRLNSPKPQGYWTQHYTGASCRTLQHTKTFEKHGFVWHTWATPWAGWHFPRSWSPAQTLRGLHPSSVLTTDPTTRSGTSLCASTEQDFFQKSFLDCIISDTHSPPLPLVEWEALRQSTAPRLPQSDGSLETRAEATSVCHWRGTI